VAILTRRWTPGRSLRRVLAAAASTLLAWNVATADPTITPAALKAAFLVNFGRFVEWPAGAAKTGPLVICVFGDDAIAGALDDTVKGHTIGGRDVVVSRVTAESLRGCHVLYLTGLDPKRSQQIVAGLMSTPVLTVSDRDEFAQSGGIVGLFVEEGKMRFAINVEAAQRAGLHISSRLLSLAKIVKDEQVHP
jgi:hypothetical protein